MEKVAEALERVRRVADTRGAEIIRSSEISRQDRELLVAKQWLQEIVRGWYMLVRPDIAVGDSGPWYSHFWDFVRCYLEERFGDRYCLTAESSLGLHTGHTLIPKQVVVIVEKGGGNPLLLPFDTSILVYADPANLPEEREEIQGVQVMPLPLVLARLGPTCYKSDPQEVQLALRMVPDAAELARVLIQGDFKKAASRLVGAYQSMGETAFANQLTQALSMRLPPIENPFDTSLTPSLISRSPYAARIELGWENLRESIVDIFPSAPGLPNKTYLEGIEELYQLDAYHSLSIEGYRVSPELVDRVRNHEWDPEQNPEDRQSNQALAARGYYEAFCQVKGSVLKILKGSNSGETVAADLQEWYRALWAPQVRADILEPHHVVGYRRGPVFIRGSRHTPLPREALLDAMETLFNCLKQEPNPAVRAILGHYFFVFIHPYPDGNGRIARFLMNTMLASGGYPWTVIRVEHRQRYFSALESTHIADNIRPFAEFVKSEMHQT